MTKKKIYLASYALIVVVNLAGLVWSLLTNKPFVAAMQATTVVLFAINFYWILTEL